MNIKAINMAEIDLFCALHFICVSCQSDAHHLGNLWGSKHLWTQHHFHSGRDDKRKGCADGWLGGRTEQVKERWWGRRLQGYFVFAGKCCWAGEDGSPVIRVRVGYGRVLIVDGRQQHMKLFGSQNSPSIRRCSPINLKDPWGAIHHRIFIEL